MTKTTRLEADGRIISTLIMHWQVHDPASLEIAKICCHYQSYLHLWLISYERVAAYEDLYQRCRSNMTLSRTYINSNSEIPLNLAKWL